MSPYFCNHFSVLDFMMLSVAKIKYVNDKICAVLGYYAA
jgi:hypothetical protein